MNKTIFAKNSELNIEYWTIRGVLITIIKKEPKIVCEYRVPGYGYQESILKEDTILRTSDPKLFNNIKDKVSTIKISNNLGLNSDCLNSDLRVSIFDDIKKEQQQKDQIFDGNSLTKSTPKRIIITIDGRPYPDFPIVKIVDKV